MAPMPSGLDQPTGEHASSPGHAAPPMNRESESAAASREGSRDCSRLRISSRPPLEGEPRTERFPTRDYGRRAFLRRTVHAELADRRRKTSLDYAAVRESSIDLEQRFLI